MESDMPSQFYPSHYNPKTNEYQPNSEHLRETGDYGRKRCCHPLLANMTELAGKTHDAGKGNNRWKQYFMARLDGISGNGAKEDHSTAGGQIIDELIPNTRASVMIQTAIYSHHGLQDCVSSETDEFLMQQRKRKAESLPMSECRDSFFAAFDKEEIKRLAEEAKKDAVRLLKEIQTRMKQWENEKPTAAGSSDHERRTGPNRRMNLYGSRNFYLGMFERMLISLLIDADRRNTEDFMTGKDLYPPLEDEGIRELWSECTDYLEDYIAKRFPDTAGMNQYKKEISLQCRDAAEKEAGRYLLSVPTGSGKTLASLRFALHHAKIHGKSRIIYVAPFRSITEQNAEEIRQALGRPDIVLEHHSSVVSEDEDDQDKYDRITEDWQAQVIVTTAVQFLNTMFAGKTGNVRRFHSLCNSVIIMDEVQALPIRVLGLFNLGMNFLTEFAGATVVLCTATQPLLENISENRLLPSRQMVTKIELYDEQFRRTEITDDTELVPGGMEVEELAAYIVAKAEEYQSVLFIGNTKNCVRELYDKVAELCESQKGIWHLSTNMVPVSRQQVLKEIKEYSDERRSGGHIPFNKENGSNNPEKVCGEYRSRVPLHQDADSESSERVCGEYRSCVPLHQDADFESSEKARGEYRSHSLLNQEWDSDHIAQEKTKTDNSRAIRHICISTQLIEAGVDVSFDCVIRSLAGLDSVIQAAGRCNRYLDIPVGRVFIVNAGRKLEDLSHLPDIRKAQETMKIILRQYKKAPETLDGCLDSRKAIEMYYQYYFMKRENEMSFPVTVNQVPTTLVRMLSGNEDLFNADQWRMNSNAKNMNAKSPSEASSNAGSRKKPPILLQAFKTAGEQFQVIDEDGKIDLVVDADDTVEEKIRQLEDSNTSLGETRKIIRYLQKYTVSISPQLRDKLEPGIRYAWNGRIQILDRNYYNDKTGVTETPKLMELLNM